MKLPARRGGCPSLAPPCAPAPQGESYRTKGDKHRADAPVYDHEDLAVLVDGLWLTDASVVQDPRDWPAWTDLPLDAVLAMLGGVA